MSLCRGIFLTALCTSCSRRVRVSASSRCDLGNSSRTSKEARGNANPRPERSTRKPSLKFQLARQIKARSAAEQTPGPEEMATPAAEAEKKTGVKRHATSGAKPTEVRFSVPELMSISAAKAIAVSAPLPQHPSKQSGPISQAAALRDDSLIPQLAKLPTR
jgi:hypothetical protein